MVEKFLSNPPLLRVFLDRQTDALMRLVERRMKELGMEKVTTVPEEEELTVGI
jgi:hypothetical protein